MWIASRCSAKIGSMRTLHFTNCNKWISLCCIFHRQSFCSLFPFHVYKKSVFACAVRHGLLSTPRMNSWPSRVRMPLALQAVPSGSSAVWLEALSKVQVVLLAFLASHLEALKNILHGDPEQLLFSSNKKSLDRLLQSMWKILNPSIRLVPRFADSCDKCWSRGRETDCWSCLGLCEAILGKSKDASMIFWETMNSMKQVWYLLHTFAYKSNMCFQVLPKHCG